MSPRSMTGFGRSDGEYEGLSWHWELRTVNGRGLDIRLRLPAGFDALEKDARALASRYMRRGNCQIALNVKRASTAGRISINEDVLEQLMAAMAKVSERMDTAPPGAEAILGIKGVLEYNEPEIDGEQVKIRCGHILASLEEALKSLDEMRRREGENMASVIADQLDEVEALTKEAQISPSLQSETVAARLKEQVARLMQGGAELDEARLYQEAAILAAKGDIREEIDRLYAHVKAGRELLGAPEPIGRRLDFLTQEFNREANTLCAKSNDKDLTATGLKLKAVIDQIREQVQNLE